MRFLKWLNKITLVEKMVLAFILTVLFGLIFLSVGPEVTEGDFVRTRLDGRRGVVSMQVFDTVWVRFLRPDGNYEEVRFNAKELEKLTPSEIGDFKREVRPDANNQP